MTKYEDLKSEIMIFDKKRTKASNVFINLALNCASACLMIGAHQNGDTSVFYLFSILQGLSLLLTFGSIYFYFHDLKKIKKMTLDLLNLYPEHVKDQKNIKTLREDLEKCIKEKSFFIKENSKDTLQVVFSMDSYYILYQKEHDEVSTSKVLKNGEVIKSLSFSELTLICDYSSKIIKMDQSSSGVQKFSNFLEEVTSLIEHSDQNFAKKNNKSLKS